jgi:hypothetical protein
VDAVEQRVGQLGQRVVDHPAERTGLDQVLHRGPADPVGMEDDRLVAGLDERVAHAHDARRRLPEHRHADAALAQLLDRPAALQDHPGHRGRRVVEDRARDLVEAEDVDHRVHDRHVALAHERAERPPAGGAGGDDQLRHPDRQRVHGRGTEQRALGAAQAQHAGDPALGVGAQHDRAHAFEHE